MSEVREPSPSEIPASAEEALPSGTAADPQPGSAAPAPGGDASLVDPAVGEALTGEDRALAADEGEAAEATPDTQGADGPEGEAVVDPAELEAAVTAQMEGEATVEEEALAQAAEAGGEGEELPADIEELEEESDSAFEKLVARARRMRDDQVRHTIHSLLFVADKPLAVDNIRQVTGLEPKRIREALDSLAGDLREGLSGVILSEVAGGWQLRTAPESADFVRRFLQVKPRRLTRAALETLAIVAYRQPVTRPEIEEIRGVDCGAVLRALLDWKLVKILGKKDEVGRPLLYGTTREFLEFFQLKDLASLPTLREFQELNEESQQIVVDELGPEAAMPEVGAIDGMINELADPSFLVAEQERAAKSEAALAELEQAMADADTQVSAVAETLEPERPQAETVDV